MKEVFFKSERIPVGGPGEFLYGESTVLSPEFLERYAGTVQLIYLDPPFGTGDVFCMSLPGKKTKRIPLYTDKLNTDDYIEFMRRVLNNAKKLLCASGSIYVHIDHRMSAHMRLLLDDVFGVRNFQNEIIWSYKSGGRSTRYFARKHDSIFFYRKSTKVYFNIDAVGSKRGAVRRNHMKRSIDTQGRVYFSIKTNGKVYKYYEDSLVYPSDVWDDIEHLHQRDPERTGYSTQKPEALIERIVMASSRAGDTVTDLFSGSGTAACVAARFKRRWVCADKSPVAMHTLRSRLIAEHSHLTMFDSPVGATFTYELDYASVPGVVFSVSESGSGHTVTLDGYGGVSPCYMALGYASGNVFIPVTYELTPSVGSSLTSPQTAQLIVQICDVAGGMSFFEVD